MCCFKITFSCDHFIGFFCLFVLSFTWIKTPLRLEYLMGKSMAVARQQHDRRAPTQMHMTVQSPSMPPHFDAHPPLQKSCGFIQTNTSPFETRHTPPALQKRNPSRERSFRTPCVRRGPSRSVHGVPVCKGNLINDGAAPSNLGQTHHVFCENTQRL